MKSKRLTLVKLAQRCGVSKTTVSAALGGTGRVSNEMRQRIQKEAKRQGWKPDPYLTQLMGYLRQSRSVSAVCNLAWLNTSKDSRRWHALPWFQGYLKGARAQAENLGYHLDEIWTEENGRTASQISRQLKARGVAGILLPLPEERSMLRELSPEMFAWVVIDESEGDFPFPRVRADRHFNMRLALKETHSLGYRRPALFLDPYVDQISQHTYSSAYLGWCHQSGIKARIAAISPGAEFENLKTFLKREKPDLIITSDGRMLKWCQQLRIRVPHSLGVVHLNLASDVSGWAGIHQNHERIGALAVDQLISLIVARQFGAAPERSILVPGEWKPGLSLRR